jgi:lysophospholipase L1-like esterase
MIALLRTTVMLAAWAFAADKPIDPARGPDLEDPSGRALDAFYDGLLGLEHLESDDKVRVLGVGDSTLMYDGVSNAIRRRMQAKFGDGGAGFVPMALASKTIFTNVADVQGSGWDACYLGRGCRKDGRYGLGGYVFSSLTEARSRISTRRTGKLGTKASSLELWYAAMQNGGTIRVRVDDGNWHAIETHRDGRRMDRWHTLSAKNGRHTLEVEAEGAVEAYGVVLETDTPGVVWDNVSLYGVFTRRVDALDAEHIAAAVAHRDPDLLMLSFGGNDLHRMAAGFLDGDVYKEELRRVLVKLRAGKPEMPCMIASVIDHVRSGNKKVDPWDVQEIVTAQRELAFEEGCAFFDSVRAMGGHGSLLRWRHRDPPLVSPDKVHLSAQGRELMGHMMFLALMRDYAQYKMQRR